MSNHFPQYGQGELTIDLAAVVDNYRRIVARAAPAEAAPVVKADAYGLGMADITPALWAAGARRFFVATPDEGMALREQLPVADILVLNGLCEPALSEYEHGRLVPVLNHLGEIERWTKRARARGRTLPAFVHFDTGMNRLGLDADERARIAADPGRLDGLRLLGWMSHLATADQPGHPMVEAQLGRFRAALASLPKAPASLANSAGIWRDQALHFDLVRPGAALYGLRPLAGEPNPMKPVLRLTVPVLQVRPVAAGETLGYGAAYLVPAATRIATLSVGYADGFFRAPGAGRTVRIGQSSAPVVGRVSMDLITVDVGQVAEPVEPGTPVELIGAGHDADALAAETGTIGYEVLTALGGRFRRKYISAEPAAAPAPPILTVAAR
jgi:alanine racemase